MSQRWVVQGYDGTYEFDGYLLGAASSKRSSHRSHEDECTYAPPGVRCSACRWIEIRIFRNYAGEYVLELTGQTIITGEKVRRRVEVTQSPHWVIEVLTQKRDTGECFIPLVAKHALSEAAALDPGVEAAFVGRVVA